uniref:Uncharacterized protein n=1 Tax=Strigamia maritima TaxID=126957 RepID=T1IHH8_STRMM
MTARVAFSLAFPVCSFVKFAAGRTWPPRRTTFANYR